MQLSQTQGFLGKIISGSYNIPSEIFGATVAEIAVLEPWLRQAEKLEAEFVGSDTIFGTIVSMTECGNGICGAYTPYRSRSALMSH